ncbi:MAG: HlyC/CorC family transporter, partial [Deltaproteobacteria bacterium]|nr:HlyC/CorC family transporter [Deltaproteobacteria bacterium]
LSLITNTIVLTFFLHNYLGKGGEFYAILILSPLVVIFGQVVPKAIFQKRRNTMVLWSIYPLWFASKLFSPILSMVNFFLKGLLKLIGSTENPFLTREELLHAINTDDNKLKIGYREKIIKRIFRFSETAIDEVMIPLVHVCALSEDTSVSEAIKMIKETGHSRIPIYKERIDHITGILIAFYLLGASPDEPIKNYSRPPFFVPETKAVDELLDEMKRGRAGMAVVVDEYGGAVGVITLEDIIEEVVGEIEDEYDKGIKFWRKVSENEYLINTKIEIDDLNEELRLSIPEGDYDTLSGFLLSEYGSIPNVGDKISHRNYNFIVTKASSRLIEEVKLMIENKG